MRKHFGGLVGAVEVRVAPWDGIRHVAHVCVHVQPEHRACEVTEKLEDDISAFCFCYTFPQAKCREAARWTIPLSETQSFEFQIPYGGKRNGGKLGFRRGAAPRHSSMVAESCGVSNATAFCICPVNYFASPGISHPPRSSAGTR